MSVSKFSILSLCALSSIVLTINASRAAGFWEKFEEGVKKLGDGLEEAVKEGVNEAFTGQEVRGRVQLANGKTATCFVGTNSAYLGPPDMVSSTQAKSVAITLTVRDAQGNPKPMLSDCDKLAEAGLLSGGSGRSSSSISRARPVDYRSIKDTELSGFFIKFPAPGGGQRANWPRVAITMVDAPAWHLQKMNQPGLRVGEPPGFGCWKFEAIIWDSETQSRPVSAFYHCTGDAIRIPGFGPGWAKYATWAGLASVNMEKKNSTGIRRTHGPNYPDTPVPYTKEYQNANFGNTFSGEVVSGILYETGFNFDKLDDSRLWFNLAPSLEPKF